MSSMRCPCAVHVRCTCNACAVRERGRRTRAMRAGQVACILSGRLHISGTCMLHAPPHAPCMCRRGQSSGDSRRTETRGMTTATTCHARAARSKRPARSLDTLIVSVHWRETWENQPAARRSQPPTRSPTAPEARPLAQGCLLDPRGEPPPRGSQKRSCGRALALAHRRRFRCLSPSRCRLQHRRGALSEEPLAHRAAASRT